VRALQRVATSLTVHISACLLAAWLSLTAVGCRSHGIDVTIQNNAKAPLRNIELDYPGASFGTGSILPGASYWYHIKPTEDGEITLSFEQEDGKTFKHKEPAVHAGEDGRMIIIVDQNSSKQWSVRVERK
jgi:hypothetical protein